MMSIIEFVLAMLTIIFAFGTVFFYELKDEWKRRSIMYKEWFEESFENKDKETNKFNPEDNIVKIVFRNNRTPLELAYTDVKMNDSCLRVWNEKDNTFLWFNRTEVLYYKEVLDTSKPKVNLEPNVNPYKDNPKGRR